MKDPISQTAPRRGSVRVRLLAGLLSLGVISLAAGEETWQPETLFPLPQEEPLEIPLPAVADRSNHSFVRQPLAFERNDGQTASEVAFLSRGCGYTLFLARNETVLKLCNADFPVGESGRLENRRYDVGTGDSAAGERRTNSPAGVLRMRLSGANPQPAIDGEQCLGAKANYFIGNQPSLWRTNIPTFGKVRYKEVYPGIDLVYYGNERQLEYDFIVNPGAKPNQIAMEFEGADEMRIDERGDLLLKVGNREVRWQKPIVYQQIDGMRHEIAGTYRLEPFHPDAGASNPKNQSLRFVSFTLSAYDQGVPLIIDPRLVYSTYLGGSGAEGWDGGQALAADAAGNVYVAGGTASMDFPTKAALNNANAGGTQDIFVAKFNPAGELVFSTYLGGSGEDGIGSRKSMVVSPGGDCYLAGYSSSLDYPLASPVQEYYAGGEYDAIVTTLKSDGSLLLFSTYLGGEELDKARSIALGPTRDVYVAGFTRSTTFPVRNAFQPELSPVDNGQQLWDGFVTRLEASGKSILYSTYYGRSATMEQGACVAVDASGNAYLALWVYATDGASQWLITKFSQDGGTRHFERRWPASMTQQKNMYIPYIALPPDGRVVVAGDGNVVNLPAINKPDPSTTLGYSEGYIAMFSATNGTYLSARYFGGSGNEGVAGLCVDAAGDIVLAGWTAGPYYQESGFPVTDPLADGPDPGKSGDAFVAKFRSTDLSLTYSTLIGGPTNDFAGGLALDSGGNPVITGYTSGQFPTVNAFQPNHAGENDAFLLKLSSGEKIQINRVGQTVRISWPMSATGFLLESADSPFAAQWNTVTESPLLEGDQNVVTVDTGSGARFFRLRKP